MRTIFLVGPGFEPLALHAIFLWVQGSIPRHCSIIFLWVKGSIPGPYHLFSIRGSSIHGDRDYNDDECFQLIEDADMGFLNTTKRGPSLAFKIGMTRYNTS